MSFGDRLKEVRTKKNLTQKQLADMLGVQNTTIANYETEVSSPKEEVLLKIFDVLNVSPNFLFQDSFNEKIIDTNSCNISCTPKEKEIIKAYRAKPEMQSAINKLLGVEEEYAEDFIIA